MQQDSNFIDVLISMRNSPTFPSFELHLKRCLDACKDMAIDPNKVNNELQLASIQGQAEVYGSLLKMFDVEQLRIIKENQKINSENEALILSGQPQN